MTGRDNISRIKIMRILLLLLFNTLQVFSIDNYYRNKSTVSVDLFKSNNNSLYSDYLKNLTKKDSLKFAEDVTSNLEYTDNSYHFRGEPKEDYPIMSDSFGVTFSANLAVYKDKKILLQGKDYFITSQAGNSVIIRDPNNIKKSSNLINPEKGDALSLGCVNTLGRLDYKTKWMPLSDISIKKIDFYNYWQFILYRKRDLNNRNVLKRFNIGENIDSNTLNNSTSINSTTKNLFEIFNTKSIEDFWIFKKEDNFKSNKLLNMSQPVLGVLTNENIYIFCEEAADLKLCYTVAYKKIILGTTNSTFDFQVTKLGIYNDMLIMSSVGKGLDFFKLVSTGDSPVQPYHGAYANFFDKNGTVRNFPVLDFVVNTNTLYVILKDYGMKIYSFVNSNLTKFDFYHPYLLSFSRSLSPGEVTTRGILVDNYDRNIPEFYLEFDTKNQESPLINKIYTGIKPVKTAQIYSDDTFTYIYDNNSKNIYLIKKAANALSPVLIYKINLRREITQGTYKIFFVKNKIFLCKIHSASRKDIIQLVK